MSVYPFNVTPEGAPTDATGSYPAVAGYTPMSTGRRVAIVLVDLVIGGAFGGIAGYVYGREESWSLPVGLGLTSVYALITLWAMLFKSARVAGLLMKAQYVDVRTGRLRGRAVFMKMLLQLLLAAVSLGIAPLILFFTSVKGPMNRNFFDRATKLMLVDGRSGRAPGAAPEQAPVAQAAPNVAAVEFHPEQAPTAWGSPQASPYEMPRVQPLTDDGGLITAVPGWPGADGSAGSPPTPPPFSGAMQAEQGYFDPRPVPPVMVDRRPARVVEHDRTELAPGSGSEEAEEAGLDITLDGEDSLTVGRPLVFGRNPAAPGSHPDAVAHPLEDVLLSKTHLLLGRDAEGVWVMDLNSTNGSAVALVRGVQARPIDPGRKVRLPEGATVTFGRHWITVG